MRLCSDELRIYWCVFGFYFAELTHWKLKSTSTDDDGLYISKRIYIKREFYLGFVWMNKMNAMKIIIILKAASCLIKIEKILIICNFFENFIIRLVL